MSNFSLHTHLTPEEHLRIHGTLAPEQVAEFMEGAPSPEVLKHVNTLLESVPGVDETEFDSVLDKLRGGPAHGKLLNIFDQVEAMKKSVLAQTEVLWKIKNLMMEV